MTVVDRTWSKQVGVKNDTLPDRMSAERGHGPVMPDGPLENRALRL